MDNKSKWISLLLSSDGFVVINKALIKIVGLNAAVLIGELVSEYNYYEKVDKLVDDTWFYSTSANIEENTDLTRFQQEQTIIHLQELKIIDIKKMGIPCKRYFSINFDQIEQMLQNCQKDSKKPRNSQFARNSQTCMQVDEENVQNTANNENDYQINAKKPRKLQFARNSQTCMSETSKQDCQKLAINNNNKTIINNSNNISNHILSEQVASEQGVKEDEMKSDILFENFKKNIDFNILLEECETKPSIKGPLENILSIIKDLYKLKENEYIRVGGRKVYTSEIHKLLNEYNIDYINYVLESLSNNFSEIKNIKAYVIATLINAPKTINLFYQGKTNNILRKDTKKRKMDDIFADCKEIAIYCNEGKESHSPPIPA